jgi:uncharacterized YigZ family protein
LFHIAKTGVADQTINKSRFIAVAEHCANEGEVLTLLQRLSAEHAHAHHLVYAYNIQNAEGGYSQRFHDAGEPSGTAGKPILQHIEGRDLINACVAVVRYFGGVKLGTGGLARAYAGTAKLALDAAVIVPFVEMCQIELVMDYSYLDSFTRELSRLNGQLLSKQFGEHVTLLAAVPEREAAALVKRYTKI